MEYWKSQARYSPCEMYECIYTAPGKNLPPSQVPKSPAGKPTPKDKIGSEKNVDTPKKIAGGKKKENNW